MLLYSNNFCIVICNSRVFCLVMHPFFRLQFFLDKTKVIDWNYSYFSLQHEPPYCNYSHHKLLP